MNEPIMNKLLFSNFSLLLIKKSTFKTLKVCFEKKITPIHTCVIIRTLGTSKAKINVFLKFFLQSSRPRDSEMLHSEFVFKKRC